MPLNLFIWRIACALAVATSLWLPIGSYAQDSSDPRVAESKQQIARQLVADRDVLLSPIQIYGLMADLFCRSYFADLRVDQSWGPNDAIWQQHYPHFAEEVLRNAVPGGIGLEEFLTFALTRGLTTEELVELKMKASDVGIRAAVARLQALGLSLNFVVQAQGPIRVSKLYSDLERQSAKRTVQILQGHLSEIEGMRPDLQTLAAFLGGPAFTKYHKVLGEAFMASAGQLESTATGKAKFAALMAKWRVKVASGAAQGSPQGYYWHTFQSDRYNIHQLDIANVRHYDGRIVYPVKHIIGGRHEALFVIVGDCTRKKRREIFNSSLSRGPYIVDPVKVAELELNDVVDGSNADVDLRAACNWANSGTQDTPLATRIAAFEKAQQDLLAQRNKAQGRSGSTENREHIQPLQAEVDKLDKLISEFNERPKKTIITRATREVGYATYYHQIVQRIEKIGTSDFPKDDGKSLYGRLVLSIPVFQDGTIYEKEGGPVVERSSGIPMLDLAALRIVRQAAPFGAFPDSMRSPNRNDVWVIISSFNFTKEDEPESTPTTKDKE